MNSMIKYILIATLLNVFIKTSAQKVFSVEYPSQADLKVFVVKYESQADLKVFKMKYESVLFFHDYILLVTPDDLIEFGMIPELIGRLPVCTPLMPLTEERDGCRSSPSPRTR